MLNYDPPPHFGVHLTIDGYRGNPRKLNSMDLAFQILDRLPTALSMHKIITPYVIRCGGNDKKDPGGISGFVMIAESHISIHTFPKRGFVSIDIYTCQNVLNRQLATQWFKLAYDLQTVEINEIVRGKKFQTLAALPVNEPDPAARPQGIGAGSFRRESAPPTTFSSAQPRGKTTGFRGE